MNRGMTIIELLVGMATALILVGVCAKVLQLGIVTYGFASRQNTSLTRTRKAMAGDGARVGVLEASREAYAVSGVSGSTVSVMAASSLATSYYVKNGSLYRDRGGVSSIQADAVTSLSVNYYLATGGMISSTSVAASATMVTAIVTIGTGTASTAKKPYSLYTGAYLRNHP